MPNPVTILTILWNKNEITVTHCYGDLSTSNDLQSRIEKRANCQLRKKSKKNKRMTEESRKQNKNTKAIIVYTISLSSVNIFNLDTPVPNPKPVRWNISRFKKNTYPKFENWLCQEIWSLLQLGILNTP